MDRLVSFYKSGEIDNYIMEEINATKIRLESKRISIVASKTLSPN